MEPNQQPKQPETAKPADSQQKAQATESRALTSKPKEDGPRRVEVSLPPVLRFRPDVWAKLHHFCYRRQTEIGGFAVTSLENLLQVEEFVTVKQEVSSASVRFSDESVADYFDEQVDKGRKPEQIGRIWLHTHPGSDPKPSSVDEETFARVFGKCEWAVLFVLARGGKTYARLRFNIGPGGEMEVPVYVDFGLPFRASDHASWEKEYERNICHVAFGPPTRMERLKAYCNMPWNEAWLEELDAIESEQEARVLQAELDDELADCLVEEREVGL